MQGLRHPDQKEEESRGTAKKTKSSPGLHRTLIYLVALRTAFEESKRIIDVQAKDSTGKGKAATFQS